MNLLKHTVCLLTALLLIFNTLPTVALTDGEAVGVIVEIADGFSKNSVINSAKKLLAGSDIGFSYGFLINGFSLTVRKSDIYKLSKLNGVKAVYSDTEYTYAAEEDEIKYEIIFSGDASRKYDPEYGKNKVIAIIDSGFLTSHEQFTLPEGTPARLKYSDVQDLCAFTNAYKSFANKKKYTESVYRNEKIPFAFDYVENDANVICTSNHGTAMAALAAGNAPSGSPAASGAAPAAQLMLMKVFDDSGKSAKTSAVIAALEDAYYYGADVISMSLGTAGGFSEHGLLDAPLEDMIDKLLDAGIPVVCSAGNNSSLGQGSVFDNYFGHSEALSKFPDSGTVHSPSTVPDVFSVASANTFTSRYPAIYLAEGNRYIPFTDTNGKITELGFRPDFNEHFDGQTLEYVNIPGLGAPEDFIGVDVKGKIALIERGEITFAEKNDNAAAAGAVAAIIYDNVEENPTVLTSMQLSESEAYAIFVSRADGLAMKNATDKRVKINRRTVYVGKEQKEPAMSDFSSSGPTPTLDIKPEITAEGDSMSVAAVSGGYTSMSGTSNAAAYTAGIIAGVIDKVSDFSGRSKTKALKALLMSAADPLFETVDETTKSYYSVNFQGAGIITPDLAKSAEIIMSGENGAKILLGNNLKDRFSASFSIKNLSDKSLSFKLTALIGTEESEGVPFSDLSDEKDPFYKLTGRFIHDYLGEDADDTVYFNTGRIKPFEDASVKLGEAEINQNSPLYTGADVSVPAGGDVRVTLSFDLARLDKSGLLKIHENGFFTEGFIILDGDTDYSIPFLGFVGDFYSVDPFAESLYDSDGAVFGGCYLYSYANTPILNNEIYLGTNNIEHSGETFVDLYSSLSYISPYIKGGDGIVYLSLSLLRNLTSLDVEVTDEKGNLVTTAGPSGTVSKAFSGGSFDAALKHRFMLWDLRHEDNDKYIFDSGVYLCKITGTDASGKIFTEEIPFTIDAVKPTAKYLGTTEKDGKRLLELEVYDNEYVQYIEAVDSEKKKPGVDNSAFYSKSLVKSTPGSKTAVSIDITSLKGDYLYVTVYDVAFNSTMMRIRIN